MRTVTISFLLILTLFCSCKKEPTELAEFEKLTVSYVSRGESFHFKKMEFTKKENKIFGKIIRPEYKISKKTAVSNDTEMNADKIKLLNDFWNQAIKFKDNCEEKYISSVTNEYTIIKDSDTLEIDRYCDWQDYEYRNLEKVLFSDFFEKLNSDRKSLEKELSNKLNGIWYPSTIKSTFERGEILELIKSKSEALNKDCHWEFSKEKEFKDNCPNLLDLKFSKSYEWDIDEGKTYLVISGGFTTREENGNTYTSVANYGATFIVKSINENRVELEYLWN
jgi:hypothetical protein